jgi:hypothetical protein
MLLPPCVNVVSSGDDDDDDDDDEPMTRPVPPLPTFGTINVGSLPRPKITLLPSALHRTAPNPHRSRTQTPS